jgi:hypothetical protein
MKLVRKSKAYKNINLKHFSKIILIRHSYIITVREKISEWKRSINFTTSI